MASPQEMGAYYENHTDPDDSSTWGEAESFEDAQVTFESAMGSPLKPPTIPGPPAPGAGMPAAKTEDLFAKSGRSFGLGCTTVLLGRVPTADTVVCPMFNPLDADVVVRLQGA